MYQASMISILIGKWQYDKDFMEIYLERKTLVLILLVILLINFLLIN